MSVYLIGLDVLLFVGGKRGGQKEQRDRQRKRDSWEIKTFWRFVDGCIHR